MKNEALQRSLDKDGYVVCDFVDRDHIERLRTFYEEGLKDENGQEFQVVLDLEDKEIVKETSEFLKASLAENAQSTFADAKIITASYVVKHPSAQAVIPPHQDWTFTDESKYASYTVWIPMQDTTIENGTLCVIPGSHKIFDHPRSSPTPQSRSLIANHISTLFPYVQPVPLKAGQALIFDNRTVHASTPNVSDQPRLIVGIGVTQKEAPLWHYYQSPEAPDTLHHYEVDEEFFIHYDNRVIGKHYDNGELLHAGKEIGTLPKQASQLSSVEVESLVRSIEGNSWQQAVIDAIAPVSPFLQPSEPAHKSTVAPEPDKEPETHPQEEVATEAEPAPVWKDERTFFEKYTIPNIIAEIRWRLTGKA